MESDFWQEVTLTPGYKLALIPWKEVTLTPGYKLTLIPWQEVTLTPEQKLTLIPWKEVTLIPWKEVTLIPGYKWTLISWKEVTLHNWERSVVTGNQAKIKRLRVVIWSQFITTTFHSVNAKQQFDIFL